MSELLAPIPVLRMFDVGRTKAFYLDVLGFAVDWEHRFEPELPLYLQIRRDGCVLHLSEHHGDGSPGVVVFAPMSGIGAFNREILSRDCTHMRPGVEQMDWGREMTVTDPSGNRIRFCERSNG